MTDEWVVDMRDVELKPSARPRVSRFGTYDPLHKYKTQLRKMIAGRYSGPFFGEGEPVDVDLAVLIGVPKSASKKKKEMLLSSPPVSIRSGDVDNYLKTVLDVCQNYTFRKKTFKGPVMEDDSQVVRASVCKERAERPGFVLRIRAAALKEKEACMSTE